jgi:hypothetical protein
VKRIAGGSAVKAFRTLNLHWMLGQTGLVRDCHIKIWVSTTHIISTPTDGGPRYRVCTRYTLPKFFRTHVWGGGDLGLQRQCGFWLVSLYLCELEPYDNPFWDFSYSMDREERRLITKVALPVHILARTNLNEIYSPVSEALKA